MKNLILMLAIATTLVFTSSCSKNSGPEKSIREDLHGTEWGERFITDTSTVDLIFYFASTKANPDTLFITIIETPLKMVEMNQIFGRSITDTTFYTYDNPYVNYRSSYQTGQGIVSKDGKSIVVNGQRTLKEVVLTSNR